MYSLLLAVLHAQEPLDSLVRSAPPVAAADLTSEAAIYNLGILAQVLDSADEYLDESVVEVEDDGDDDEDEEWQDEERPLAPFVLASRAGTNTADARRTRFLWEYKALTQPELL